MAGKAKEIFKPVGDEQKKAVGQIINIARNINAQGYAFHEQISAMQKLTQELKEWYDAP